MRSTLTYCIFTFLCLALFSCQNDTKPEIAAAAAAAQADTKLSWKERKAGTKTVSDIFFTAGDKKVKIAEIPAKVSEVPKSDYKTIKIAANALSAVGGETKRGAQYVFLEPDANSDMIKVRMADNSVNASGLYYYTKKNLAVYVNGRLEFAKK